MITRWISRSKKSPCKYFEWWMRLLVISWKKIWIMKPIVRKTLFPGNAILINFKYFRTFFLSINVTWNYIWKNIYSSFYFLFVDSILMINILRHTWTYLKLYQYFQNSKLYKSQMLSISRFQVDHEDNFKLYFLTGLRNKSRKSFIVLTGHQKLYNEQKWVCFKKYHKR